MPDKTKSGKVEIGNDFPLQERKDERAFSDDHARFWIALCVLVAYLTICLGDAISGILDGSHSGSIITSIQPFVGILIGYYFGRRGGRDDEKDHTGSA